MLYQSKPVKSCVPNLSTYADDVNPQHMILSDDKGTTTM